MRWKRPKDHINLGIPSLRRAVLIRPFICGFYVTRSDKSSVDAEKVGFTLFFCTLLSILARSNAQRGGTMTSTRKILLGTAAATIAVTGGANTGAQAADAMLKKAPPIQYVRICDRYGYGFFQIPGSSICLQLRGQVQSDNDYQPVHDAVFVSASKTSGSYGGAAVGGNAANAQVVF